MQRPERGLGLQLDKLSGKPQVVVDAATGTRVITVIKNSK
jgi:hypothetical protein